MNESILWHQDPPFVADYMNFYLDKTNRILGVGSDNTNIKVLGATNGPIPLKVGSRWFIVTSDVIVDSVDDLDTGSLAAGSDYYVYACDNSGSLVFKVSTASTYPSGYTANNSRKIGGFHTLSVDVGTISGHSLTGFLSKDILPASIWCLKHRARNLNNRGLVYDPHLQLWIQIYHASDDGNGGVQSVNGATILDTMTWLDFVDRGNKVGMRLLNDREFQQAAMGSNEGTNVAGSSDPVTCALRLDTAGRTMIANNGCIGMTGEMYAWTLTPGSRVDGMAAHTHTENTATSYTKNATTGNASVDVVPAWSWKDIGGKGQRYTQGTYGETKLAAGGYWLVGANCGSRGRFASYYPWSSYTSIGGRFCCESL